MDGIDNILCKTGLNLIRTLTYKCNTFRYVHFEEVILCTFVLFTISKNCVSKGGDFLLCNDLNLNKLVYGLKYHII